nr:MAG TPA: hypothetical protein [Caudoviricetes sp.]
MPVYTQTEWPVRTRCVKIFNIAKVYEKENGILFFRLLMI